MKKSGFVRRNKFHGDSTSYAVYSRFRFFDSYSGIDSKEESIGIENRKESEKVESGVHCSNAIHQHSKK